MNWISVEDRLPEKEMYAIIRCKHRFSKEWEIVPGYFCYEFNMWSKFFYGNENCNDAGEVSHWMPLPEPPREND